VRESEKQPRIGIGFAKMEENLYSFSSFELAKWNSTIHPEPKDVLPLPDSNFCLWPHSFHVANYPLLLNVPY
jgi:hypothetical protein